MRVTVLYFGVLKDVMGHRSVVMEVAEGASVAELVGLHRLGGRTAGAVWDSIAVAVNQEYARSEDLLKEGDEVAFLPPVSGGCFGLDGRAYSEAKAPFSCGAGQQQLLEATTDADSLRE